MAYRKPSVTVEQRQKTVSPTYPEPDFQSCVVGPGYYWQDPAREDSEMNSVYDHAYSGEQLVVSGEQISDHAANMIEDTIIVDLVRTSGSGGEIGSVEHLDATSDFTVNGSEITINADLDGFTGDSDKADVRVGFLAPRTDMKFQFEKITEAQQIRDWIGEPKSFNPLAFGAELVLSNSGAATNVLGVDAEQAPDAQDHGNAITELENKDVYSIAPLTQTDGEISKYLSHVVDMSKPENKRNRIAFTNHKVTTFPESDFPTVSEKNEVAQDVQNYATAKQERRFFNIFPDGGYVQERRHVSTLTPSFMKAVFGAQFDLLPRFISAREINGVKYKAFQEIDSTALTNIKAAGMDYITAYMPVPGYYFSAAVSGSAVGKDPEDPLTNTGISGLAKVYRSNDYFSENQLNTIAEGGNWIIEELGPNALINRHQLSTDTTSIQAQELSITTALDYVTYYYRDLFKPMIGRFNITPEFLQNLNAMANFAADKLVEAGRVEDITILELYQDEAEPDTVKMSLSVTPLYPVNSIKIILTF